MALLPPPRITGDNDADKFALYDWLADVQAAVNALAPPTIVTFDLSGTDQTATYAFARSRTDTNYRVEVVAESVVDEDPADLFGSAAFTVKSIARTVTGFTVTFCSPPGDGNTITFNAFIYET